MADYQATRSGLLGLGVGTGYQPTQGPLFFFVLGTGYQGSPGPMFLIAGGHGYQPTKSNRITLDSTGTAGVVISAVTQRVDTNILDVEGVLYNDTGSPITVKDIYWATSGIGGPWVEALMRTDDPAYNWPNGTPSGQVFKVPIELFPITSSPFNLWIRMRVGF